MSLTSYRAAPPRVSRVASIRSGSGRGLRRELGAGCGPGGDLLFRTLRCSTIGAEGFHGRVRDGIGCLAPRYGHQACPWLEQGPAILVPAKAGRLCDVTEACLVRPRAGTSVFRVFMGFCRCTRAVLGGGTGVPPGSRPIERLVPVSCAGYPASTSGLSTWWSSTALGETWF